MTPAPATIAVVVAGAYLLGSIPVAWLAGRRAGVELRDVGSGNPGTSNLFRNAGLGVAMFTGPMQFVQGVAAVLLARAAGGPAALLGAAAVAAVAGSGWPVWLRFDGQRGVAVATGAVAALSPPLLAVLLAFFACGALLHAIAPLVLAGFAAASISAVWIGGGAIAIACAALSALVLLRRLQGTAPAGGGGTSPRTLARRLLYDETPGQVLVGPRSGGPAPRG